MAWLSSSLTTGRDGLEMTFHSRPPVRDFDRHIPTACMDANLLSQSMGKKR
jgi:hypothetical protein